MQTRFEQLLGELSGVAVREQVAGRDARRSNFFSNLHCQRGTSLIVKARHSIAQDAAEFFHARAARLLRPDRLPDG